MCLSSIDGRFVEFISTENPGIRGRLDRPIGPWRRSDNPPLHCEGAALSGNTIQPEDWQSVDSGEAFQSPHEAQGQVAIEKHGQTGLWFAILDFTGGWHDSWTGLARSFDLPNRSRLDVIVDPQTGEILDSGSSETR
jgi:hypothetical protein